MATYDEISEITGIPKTTLIDWNKAGGWRSNIFWMLRAMHKDELTAHIDKGMQAKEEKMRKKRKKELTSAS